MIVYTKPIIPTEIHINDTSNPLSGDTLYYLAAVEVGYDLVNGGVTFGPVTAFTVFKTGPDSYRNFTLESRCYCCGQKTTEESSYKEPQFFCAFFEGLQKNPGVIAIFLSKDDKTYQMLKLVCITENSAATAIICEPVLCATKFSKSTLKSSDEGTIIGSRQPTYDIEVIHDRWLDPLIAYIPIAKNAEIK